MELWITYPRAAPQGWLIIPHTRRSDTQRYEFVLAHDQTGERAIVQSSPVAPDTLNNLPAVIEFKRSRRRWHEERNHERFFRIPREPKAGAAGPGSAQGRAISSPDSGISSRPRK
jgi:hypothetical protein